MTKKSFTFVNYFEVNLQEVQAISLIKLLFTDIDVRTHQISKKYFLFKNNLQIS